MKSVFHWQEDNVTVLSGYRVTHKSVFEQSDMSEILPLKHLSNIFRLTDIWSKCCLLGCSNEKWPSDSKQRHLQTFVSCNFKRFIRVRLFDAKVILSVARMKNMNSGSHFKKYSCHEVPMLVWGWLFWGPRNNIRVHSPFPDFNH